MCPTSTKGKAVKSINLYDCLELQLKITLQVLQIIGQVFIMHCSSLFQITIRNVNKFGKDLAGLCGCFKDTADGQRKKHKNSVMSKTIIVSVYTCEEVSRVIFFMLCF